MNVAYVRVSTVEQNEARQIEALKPHGIDKWFTENIRTAKGIVAEARVLGGRAVLTDLTLDGRSFRELLKERQK